MGKLALLIALLMSLAMFFGCANSAPQQETTVSVGEEALAEGEADYEIITDDRSLTAEDGTVLISHTYERVVLKSLDPVAAKINGALEKDRDTYFAQNENLVDYLESAQTQGPFHCEASARVLWKSQKHMSVRISIDWWMGGVTNYEQYALNFDLQTGEAITLAQLLPDSEAQIRQTILDFVSTQLGEDLIVDPVETLAGFAYDQIAFYIEEGEVVVVFPTYVFASGAGGATVIKTGMKVEG